MPRKPANITYGVDDKPPLGVSLLLGLEHVSVCFIAIILPVMVVKQIIGLDPLSAAAFISLSMIAGGITTILQAIKKGPVGSGYLCPSVCGPSYLSATMMAAGAGGLPLIFGMTAFVGVAEVAFSRVMRKLRFLFPFNVTGVVVALVGIIIIPMADKDIFGFVPETGSIDTNVAIVGFLTFAIMVALNVYGKGKIKLYSFLIGMFLGYVLSFAFGLIPASEIAKITSARIFSVPYIRNMSWDFDFNLAIPFIVAALCSSLKTVGDLATCQKINDADWKRPDMETISGGIFADGLGGVIPGLIGGFGQSTSSSNVGLSIASGATSRRIALTTGIIFIALGFLPKLANIFIIMPKPVMGAGLVFVVCFMIVAGFQIMTSRMLDTRKILVVGTAIIFGLSADIVPEIYANVHPWIQPIFSSSLSLGTITAIVMNLILRIGIAKHKTLDFTVGTDNSEKIITFMEKQGGLWGMRRDILDKAISAMNEFAESADRLNLRNNNIKMDVSFDEFNLDVAIEYRGDIFKYPEKAPTREDLLADETAFLDLSRYMIAKYCTSIKTSSVGDNCKVKLHFEH